MAPGDSVQNWYCGFGLGHELLAVNVAVVPTGAVLSGAEARLSAVHVVTA